MAGDNVHPIVEPDAEQMLRHVQHLFGGDLDGCHEGRIELAWTDFRDGRLRHAEIFGTDQMEDLVERAVRENRIPGQNLYVGQALRKPDIAPFGRCADDDFFALTAFYADLDDDVVATARISYRHRGCPPTGVVVTGRHPHVRAQMLWRLETPERDPDVCRRQNRALADALGGDPSVINPGRVMRFGGSVAWAVKPDRIVERTEFVTFDDGRPRIYLPGQLTRAFPPVQSRGPDPDVTSKPATQLHIGSEFDGVTVDGCLAAVRAGDHWHDNLVRLTGHWIAREWSDAEILTAAEALTLPGYTVDQTRREVGQMIAGGRTKWNLPNPAHEVGATKEPLPPIAPAFVDRLNVAMVPRRCWLLGRSLLRGNLTLKVAPPGVGKSTLGIEQAVAIVTGRPITGQEVHEQTKVWVYNNEDDADELKRRLAAVLQHWDIPLDEVRGRLALNSGADRPLVVAKADGAGSVIRLPDVDACIEHIRGSQIGAFIVDPFVETHEVTENSNEQIKAVAAMFREIARRGNCAVMLVHHTAKPPQGTSDGHAGNLNTARGASALAGVARIIQTLFSMSARDAEQHGVDGDERHLFVRLDDAKANLGLISGQARWFRRVGVTIANGDEVGVLVPEELQPVAEAGADPTRDDFHRTIIAALLAQVSEDGITVNAAARVLAWGPHQAFHKYRQTDDRGHERVSRTLRDAIVAACRACTTVVDGPCSRGFTCDEQANPRRLRRFEHPFTPTTQGLDRPEFERD